MTNQTAQNDENNRGKNEKEALLDALRPIWQGKQYSNFFIYIRPNLSYTFVRLMKRDFSQKFRQDSMRAYLLLEDSVGKTFYCTGTPVETQEFIDDWAVPMCSLFKTKLVAGQLAKFLYERGFALVSYRELNRQTNVAFSFADETTHGTFYDTACYHVVVDRVVKSQRQSATRYISTDLRTLQRRLNDTFYFDPTIARGIDTVLYGP